MSPETPHAANALKIKVRTVSSGSQGLVVTLPARTVSLCPWVVTRATMGPGREMCLLIPSLILLAFSFPGVTPSVNPWLLLCDDGSAPWPCLSPLVTELSSARLPATKVQLAGLAPVTLRSLAGHRSSCALCLSCSLRVTQKSSYLKITPSNSRNPLPAEEMWECAAAIHASA